ncbi:MAG TPA: hypothetical protein VK469_23380 [Candidatus Kapabacteria bacterium]|nr:hypothetical protein [Candidatus Kapabacteria bacterium]
MSQYIRCESLKSVFRIEKLDTIKRVCGYDIKNLPPEYEFFDVTLAEINNEAPTLSQQMKMLKNILPILIEQIKNQNVCVIQLSGDLIEGHLTEYYQYILTSEGKRRYYCPELIYNTFKRGFIYSWISFDFNKDQLKIMPFNESDVLVEGLIIAPNLPDIYDTFFKSKWDNESMESLLTQSIIYFATDNDFDYFGVASRIPMEIIIKKWQEGLDLYDKEKR